MANAPQLTVGLGFDLDEASAKKVVKGMERLGEYLEKSAQDASSKVAQTWRTKLNSLGNDLEKVGMRLSASLSLPFALIGTKIVEATRDYDRLKQSLTAIEGTSEKMGKRLEILTEIAKAPGIGFEQAIQGDVRLRAVGISAETSAKALTQFANAIAFTGGTASQLDLVTYQLSQMSAKGKVLGNDLRPIIEQAPAVAGALKAMFGSVSSDDIQTKLEQMGKGSKEFIEDLIKKLEELPRVKGGFNNAIENMGIAVKGFFAKIGESLFSAIDLEKAFQGIESTLNTLAVAINNLSPEAKKFMLVIASMAIIAPPVLLALGSISVAVAAISAPVVAVVAVVAASMYLIVEYWEGLAKTLSNSSFFSGFASLFGGMFEIISNLMGVFANLFTGNWASLGENIKNIFKGLNNAVIGVFQIIIGTVGKGMAQLFEMVGMDSVAKGISGGTSAFLEFAEKSKFSLNTVKGAVEGVSKAMGDLFKSTLPPKTTLSEEELKKQAKELEKLTAWLKKSAEESEKFEKSITKINKELEELRKKEWKESPMGQAVILDHGSKFQSDLKRKAQKDLTAKNLKLLQKIDFGFEWTDTSLEDAEKSLKNRLEVLKDRIKGSVINVKEVTKEEFTLMGTMLRETMMIVGNSVGDAFSGMFEALFTKSKDVKFDFKDVLANFLKAMGQMVSSMGAAILAAGLGLSGSVFGMGEGAKSIAAGVGLMALGGAMMGGGSAIMNNKSPSQSPQYNGAFTAPVQGMSNQNNKVEFVIQGTTLKGVLNNVNNSFG